MNAVCKLVGTLLLLLTAIGHSAAAVPEDSIQVGFRGGLCLVRYPGRMGIRYDLEPDGALLSEEFRASELFSGGAPDACIAETINNGSRCAPETCIQLAVCIPEKTNFSTITKSIERLKRLAAENAVDGSKLEIVVFPLPDCRSTAYPNKAGGKE